MPRGEFQGAADITSVEAHFSRSIKIRMGVADCLYMLAERGDQGEPVAFESIADLAGFAANYVFEAGWDLRPGSSETAVRWVKQYTTLNSFFELREVIRGGLVVCFRQSASKSLVSRMINNHRPRKRRRYRL